MSKFEELCQAYAKARQEAAKKREACQDFADIFIQKMEDYFECSLAQENPSFDEQGLLHFQVLLTLSENPHQPAESATETISISLSVNQVIDNYIVTVYPWMKDFKLFWNEFDKFEEVYEFIFEKLKNYYNDVVDFWSEDYQYCRNLGW